MPVESLATQPALASLLDAAQAWYGYGVGETSDTSRAGRALAEGDYAAAARLFDRLLVENPSEPALLLGKAMALAGLGRHEDALPLFESALEHDPGHTAARFNLAITLTRLGQGDAAAGAFRELLRRDPRHERARFNLAALLQARGAVREALALWKGVTEPAAPPPDARPLPREHLLQAWSHRGECAMRLNRSGEARVCFEKVAQLAPGDARAWLNLGIAQVSAGNRKAAGEALEKAVQIDPKLVPALNQLAYVQASYYRDVGDESFKTAALDLCRRSLVIAPAQGNIRTLRFALEHETEAVDMESTELSEPER